MKPWHAKWAISFYDFTKNHSDIVMAGRRKSKIEVFNSEQGRESDPLL